MAEKEFYNLDVVITQAAEGYLAHIVDAPQGRQAQAHFTLPFTALERDEWLLTFRNPRHSAEMMGKAREFGGPLFEAVFGDGDMRHVLRTSKEQADIDGRGLRIRLRMNDTPELAELPWEYLYDASRKDFFILSSETPIVRFIELSDRTKPLELSPPMNVLVVIAAPTDQVALDTDREWAKINDALAPLVEAGQVTVDRLPDGRLDTFIDALPRKDYHVIHFIGHGEFDKSAGDGTLLFENADRKADRVPAEMLAQLLADKDSIRLMVLNACEGSYSSDATVFAGTAQSLVRKGVPGLVAMQFKISDQAAILFSQTFYDLIAQGYPLDTALAEARKRIYTMRNNIEWGTPILFVRAKETKLFATPPKEAPVTEENEKKQESAPKQSVSIGGNVGGSVNISEGDINTTTYNTGGGDVVQGDKTVNNSNTTITTGNITADNLVIGSNQNVTFGPTPFSEAKDAIKALELSSFKEAKAREAVAELEDMQGEDNVEQEAVDYYLGLLEQYAPPVAEALITTLTNPGAAVGKGLELAIKAYRQSRK